MLAVTNATQVILVMALVGVDSMYVNPEATGYDVSRWYISPVA